jgi:hypothetical protein
MAVAVNNGWFIDVVSECFYTTLCLPMYYAIYNEIIGFLRIIEKLQTTNLF